MVPDVVSVYFGLFRNTVEFVGIKLQVISIALWEVRREQTNVPLYFEKQKKSSKSESIKGELVLY